MALVGVAKLVDTQEQVDNRTLWAGTQQTRTTYTLVYEQMADRGTAIADIGSPGGSYLVVDRSTRKASDAYDVQRTVWSYSGSWT